MTFADVPSAIRWFAPLWTDERTDYPMRLHYRDDVEPESLLGTPEITPQFMRYLMAAASDVEKVTETVTCGHHRLPRDGEVWQCVDCLGSGVYQTERVIFRKPLAAAFRRLRRQPGPWPRGFMPPANLILAFAACGWSLRVLASELAVREGPLNEYVLLAFRRLRDKYSDAPRWVQRTNWVDKSDAQRAAEEAA